MTLTLIMGHKESMLQARFTLQRSSTIFWPLSMLGTPKDERLFFLAQLSKERSLSGHSAMA